MRRLGILLAVLLVLAGLALAAAWVVATPAGLQWLYARIEARVPGELAIESLHGRLIGPIEVRNASYRSDAADADIAHARLAWSPLALLSGTLEIDALEVRGARIELGPAQEAPPDGEPGALRLPFELNARRVRLEDIAITSGGRAPYRIHSVELDADIDGRLARIERLRVDAQHLRLSADGAIGVAGDAEGTLATDWQVEIPDGPRIEGGGEIAGNLDRLRIDQRIAAPVEAGLRARIEGLREELAWQIELDVPEADVRRLGFEGPEARASLSLEAEGNRDRFRSDGTLRARLPELPPLAGRFRVNGDFAGPIVLESLTLQPENSEARLTVQGQWHPDDSRWQANVSWQQLEWPLTGDAAVRSPRGTLIAGGDLRQYRLELDATAAPGGLPPLQWHAEGSGDRAGIAFDRLRIEAEGASVAGTARAAWSPEVRWQTNLRWQALRWPLTGQAAVTSPEGALEASGDRERYRFDIEAATAAAELPPIAWRARGAGDRERVAIDEVRIDALATTLHGNARAAWSPALVWEAELRGENIDPAAVWPQWPGDLALRARASGGRDEVRVAVERLAGTLRGYRFSATGRGARRHADYPELALELRSGGATATLNGSLAGQWDLAWRVNADDLGDLLPAGAGRLSAAGRVTGPRAQPRLGANATGTKLVYQASAVEKLSLDASVDLSDRTRSRVALEASGGALYGRPFERLGLDAEGFLKDHSTAIAAAFPDVGLRARLAGGYANRLWRGKLTQSTLTIADDVWTLAGTPKLIAGPGRALLEQSCWRAAGARVCAALDHVPAVTRLSAAAERLPLALFAPLLPPALAMDGAISGSAQARLAQGRVTTADADFRVGPGTLSLPANAAIDYERADINVTIDAQGLRARTDLVLPKGDGGSARIALPRFHDGGDIAQQPIDGRITLTMRDLAPLAAVLPRLEELRGRFDLDFTLAGSLADPRLNGEAAVTDAQAYVPAAGIQLERVRVTAAAADGDTIEIGGEAYSGGGQLGVSGRVTFPGAPPWRMELRVAGSEFRAAALGKTQVYVSPDLRAQLRPGAVEVTGTVRIPRATFTLITPEQRDIVTPSPDVVIVNAPEEEAPPPALWQVTARIDVILGDQVTFRGFGLDSRITGEVQLMDAPRQATTARGELRVATGQYEAYGQKLEIERGRLVFVGGPVSNPGIDARAVRRVDNVTAGVEVAGTLRSPQLTLFSDPPMGQADALSYLLFGRPMSGASSAEGRSLATAARALQLAGGERLAQRIGSQFGFEDVEIETGTRQESAALVLGRRLSPRLYVNYSIGLFEPSNILRLRYQLSTHWSLEAQSGTSSGGDLLYIFER